MRRLSVFLCAAALLAAASIALHCRDGEVAAPAAAPTTEDWVAELVLRPEAASDWLASSSGWALLWSKRYAEAAEAFESATPPEVRTAGLISARRQLAEFYRSLAELLAEVQLEYLDNRRLLVGSGLLHESYVRGVALWTLGRTDEARSAFSAVPSESELAPMARAWRHVLDGDDPDSCGAQMRERTAGRTGPADGVVDPSAGDRWTIYQRAFCGSELRAAATPLGELARTPIAREPGDEIGPEDGRLDATSTEVVHPDLAALVASGVVQDRLRAQAAATNARAQQALLAGPTKNLAVAFSPWPTVDAAKGEWRPDIDALTNRPVREVLDWATEERPAWDRWIAAMESPRREKIVGTLGLAQVPVNLRLRRIGRLMFEQGRCADALRVLETSRDPKRPYEVTTSNDPAFLVLLARVALCAGRGNEAMGSIRALEPLFPEARMVREAVGDLLVSRIMKKGGPNGSLRAD